ncbi:hypothetical protein IEQ34_003940 [Dendrobium chrysotoxum]|uniref:Uncharacterized protein n=1 Tax=Dendrobium chrysotoxum TaxID=161865 RepID=A0AAV7HEH7_DENCH|nr:hypothetical protein IEQ34_003940 [Dendrobium chrysotoxum]
MACRFYLFSFILVVLLFTTSYFAQDDAETTPSTDDSGTANAGQDFPETSNPTADTPDDGSSGNPGEVDPPSDQNSSSNTNCLKCQSIPPSIPCNC